MHFVPKVFSVPFHDRADNVRTEINTISITILIIEHDSSVFTPGKLTYIKIRPRFSYHKIIRSVYLAYMQFLTILLSPQIMVFNTNRLDSWN